MRMRFLGGLSAIGGSCLLLEDEEQALLIDAGASNTAHGPGFPDFGILRDLGKKLQTVCITHAHFDHAGAAGFLHDIYPGLTFIGSRETLAFLHGRYSLPKSAPVQAAAAGEGIARGNWEITPLAVRHSIPGALALHIAAPSGRVLISGDFRSFADPAALARFASPDIFICESTNAGLPPSPDREEAVHAELCAIIARHARARVLFTCFSSNLARLAAVLLAARDAGVKVYTDSEAMRNACAIAREIYADPLWGPYPALPGKDFPESCLVLSSGSQGEEGSRLLALLKNGFLARSEDALILSAAPIPGNEGDWRFLADTAACGPARLYLPPLSPVHISGHACRDELAAALEIMQPGLVIPVHGQRYQRRRLAELAAERGIESRIPDDEESISLDEGKVTFHRDPPSGPCRAKDEFLSGAQERRNLARFGIAFIVLICDRERRSVRARISVRGFFRNDANTDFIEESCRILEAEVLELWSQGIFAHTRIRRMLQEKMAARFLEGFALAPLVSVLYHELSSPA